MPDQKKELNTVEDYKAALESAEKENAQLRKQIEELTKGREEKEPDKEAKESEKTAQENPVTSKKTGAEEKEAGVKTAGKGKNVQKSEGESLLDDIIGKMKAAEGLFLIVAPQYAALLKAIETLLAAFKSKEKESEKEKTDAKEQRGKASGDVEDEDEKEQPTDTVEKEKAEPDRKKGVKEFIQDAQKGITGAKKEVGTNSKEYTAMCDAISNYLENSDKETQNKNLLDVYDTCSDYVKKNQSLIKWTTAGNQRLAYAEGIVKGLQGIPEFQDVLEDRNLERSIGNYTDNKEKQNEFDKDVDALEATMIKNGEINKKESTDQKAKAEEKTDEKETSEKAKSEKEVKSEKEKQSGVKSMDYKELSKEAKAVEQKTERKKHSNSVSDKKELSQKALSGIKQAKSKEKGKEM